MAISDYLTEEEWDVCFYRYCEVGGNFGDSMTETIELLLEKGHNFPGLDDDGYKLTQIDGTTNPFMFLGNPHGINPIDVLNSAREWLKDNYPELLTETDEEWEKQVKEAANEQE